MDRCPDLDVLVDSLLQMRVSYFSLENDCFPSITTGSAKNFTRVSWRIQMRRTSDSAYPRAQSHKPSVHQHKPSVH
jgi:hypothetical protein